MPQELDLHLAPRTDELPRLAEALEALARSHELPAPLTMQLNLALDELLTNIATHGQTHPEQPATEVLVRLRIEGNRLHVSIIDDGPPFDPREIPPPDLDADVEDRQIGGLGLHLVRHFTDEMHYRRRDRHNELVLIRKLSDDPDLS
ncbi:MAG: ATP-binding protein [Halothiobacillaceae bacterium]